jgi:hypothetical protein
MCHSGRSRVVGVNKPERLNYSAAGIHKKENQPVQRQNTAAHEKSGIPHKGPRINADISTKNDFSCID